MDETHKYKSQTLKTFANKHHIFHLYKSVTLLFLDKKKKYISNNKESYMK